MMIHTFDLQQSNTRLTLSVFKQNSAAGPAGVTAMNTLNSMTAKDAVRAC